MTISIMQSAALVILLLALAVLVIALALVILYLVIRSAVRSGIDRSNLAAFVRQYKLAELQAKYEEKPETQKRQDE